MSSISLTTSTVGSEVGVRGHRIRANIHKVQKRTCQMTYGLYNPEIYLEFIPIQIVWFEIECYKMKFAVTSVVAY